MALLVLMVGLPGSGKTTRAMELEKQLGAVRLTPDEWIAEILGKDVAKDALDRARDPVEAALTRLAVRLLEVGTNVILDFGFWGRSERDQYRALARDAGADCAVYFLDPPMEVLRGRIQKRNLERPGATFVVLPHELEEWDRLFERPLAEELKWSR